MATEWAQVVAEVGKVPGLVVEIYGDLAKPGVRQVGKALDTVLGLGNTVLWPIAWANERSRIYLERNLENYRKRLEQIPEEKIVGVAPEVGVPVAEKLAYVRDETLAGLYLSLLTVASNSDTVSLAHPSFVNIINNLSPDEAKILEQISPDKDLCFANAKWEHKKTRVFSPGGEFLTSARMLFESNLAYPANLPAYISNLVGLGLVSAIEGREMATDDEYKSIEKFWREYLPTHKDPERELKFKRGVVCLTLFGEHFRSACQPTVTNAAPI